VIIDIEGRKVYCTEIRLKEEEEETLLFLGTMTAHKFDVAQHYQVGLIGQMQYLGKNSESMLQFTTGTAIHFEVTG